MSSHLRRLIVWFLLLTAIIHPSHAVEFTTVSHAGKSFTVARVNLKQDHLGLFGYDEAGKPLGSFAKLAEWLRPHGQTLVFAMNAGMYHPGLKPVGLFIADGKTMTGVNAADGTGNFFLKPNGVFCVTPDGARVVESSQFETLTGKVLLATQSGPLLVQDGILHPAFTATSVSRLIRNGVGVPSSGSQDVIFAISDEPVNFHEFATFFRDALHCPNALFLDGTISSLYVPFLKRHDSGYDLGPILGVTEPSR